MALRKPSDLFNQKETSGVFESPEISSHITESYDKFRSNFDKVNELSEKVEVLSKELSEKLTKSDLENAMLSQLMILDENFKSLQNQVKGLNKQDLKDFKETVSNLSEIVDNLVETELPKYKKQITKNELYVGEQVNQLQGIVETNISGIREEIDEKFDNIADVVDNNIEYFNQKLEETSTQVKKTTETYTNISKILENKVSQENEKFEEYSELIENLSQAFEQLSSALKEELIASSQFIEEKFEDYKKEFESISSNLKASVDVRLEDYHKEILDIKADVVISEQHIKNVDKYIQEHHQELIELKEEVFTEIEKLPVGNLQENIERLEKKIDYIKETYSKIEPEVVVKEVIKEGLLNEPPETDNSDPLTPLDKNFVTLDQLQEHYRLFINRIQQQLSTIGGGGETRLKYLDDIVGIATNPSAYDGKFLKYNGSIGKFEFTDVDITNDSWSDGINGPYTLGSVAIGKSVANVKLDVVGDANFTGVVTATSFSIGGIGSAINITNDSITGPTEIIIDPKTVGDNTGIVRVKGDLYVDGNATYIQSTIVEIADYQVGIATTIGSNTILDGAGIGIGSLAIRKTITWDNSNSALKSSENWNLNAGKVYEINGVEVLNSTTLGSGVTNSSLTSVGTLGNLLVSETVGIGTTNPTSALTVNGDINLIDTNQFTTTVQVATATTNRTITFPDATGTVALVAGSSGQLIFNLLGVQTGSSNLTYTDGGGLILTNPMRISPASAGIALSVIPTSTSNAGLFSGTTSADMVRITQLGTGNALVVEDSANPDATPFVVRADGNTGIGTNNPTSLLHVLGNSLITGVSTVGLAITSTPPSNSQMSFELTSDTNLRIKVRGTDGVLRSANITLA